jgi:transcriptional regulator GlxA family with amidase domain
MCLYLVARLHGEAVARSTARYMEYAWDKRKGVGFKD